MTQFEEVEMIANGHFDSLQAALEDWQQEVMGMTDKRLRMAINSVERWGETSGLDDVMLAQLVSELSDRQARLRKKLSLANAAA